MLETPRDSHSRAEACDGERASAPALTRAESASPQSSLTAGQAETLTCSTFP